MTRSNQQIDFLSSVQEAIGEDEGTDLTGTIRALAQFRYALRRFLRFSEDVARECGVTPQQHQLMLGVAGFKDRNRATISELAEFLQEKNHSVVGLVERAVESGLVRRTQDSTDRRVVVVSLTRRGEAILNKLTQLHRDEVRKISRGTEIPVGTPPVSAAAAAPVRTPKSLSKSQQGKAPCPRPIQVRARKEDETGS